MALMEKGWTLDEATSRKLTDEERKLLESWNRHDLVQANDQVFGETEEQQVRRIDDGNTGDVDPFTADTGADTAVIVQPGHNAVTDTQAERARRLAAGESDLEADIEAQRDAEADLASSVAPEDDGGSSDDQDEYGKMKNSQLREVCDQKGLPRSGDRATLLERLRTADAEA